MGNRFHHLSENDFLIPAVVAPTAAAAAAQTLDLCALGVRRYTGYDVNEELVLRNAALYGRSGPALTGRSGHGTGHSGHGTGRPRRAGGGGDSQNGSGGGPGGKGRKKSLCQGGRRGRAGLVGGCQGTGTWKRSCFGSSK